MLIFEIKDLILSKQISKFSIAVGAIIKELEFTASKANFIGKLPVSIKKANETEHWLMLLCDTKLFQRKISKKLQSNCISLLAMHVSSIKTAKSLK